MAPATTHECNENGSDIRTPPHSCTVTRQAVHVSPIDSMDDDGDEAIDRTSLILADENDRLRQELHQLKSQVAILQKQLHLSSQTSPSAKNQESKLRNKTNIRVPGVVLELPKNLKQQTGNPLNCFIKNSKSKDHQSVSTTDERETEVPRLVVEAHESSAGLHHRLSAHQKEKRDPNDESLSSQEEVAEYDMDDDDEICVESQQLIGPANKREVAQKNENIEEESSFYKSVLDRAGWLVGLLILQSLSSFILARNELLLQQHLVIVRFLTMLVGAGGNAGNQASVRVIRGLAVGTIDSRNTRQFLRREFLMGLALSLVLGTAGCIRAAVFMTPMMETIAITTSLFMIVIISILLGAVMPLGMQLIGIDPAHSSTTIQVVMDILGVLITVQVSSFVLDAGFHSWLNSMIMDV